VNKIIPIFSSHYSFGKSILTLEKPYNVVGKKNVPIEKPEDIDTTAPISVFSIAKAYGLKEIFLVESNLSGFVEAYENSKSCKIPVRFGLKLTICDNIDDKSEKSFRTESKVIIWSKNSAGEKDLYRLYTKASTDGFYYIPRLSWKLLNELMTDNLSLSIPPYDSFLHNNLLDNGTCVPIFNKIAPRLFYAYMELPFDMMVINSHRKYADDNHLDLREVSPIYYYNSENFRAYTTMRAIQNKGTFLNPGIEFFCSDRFSFENYMLKTGNKI
jgi:DNA polymerase III alpha subunit